MQEVEWDFTTQEAIALRSVDGTARGTGIPRNPDHNIQWRPLEYDYPDNYAPRFPSLLGQQSMYRYDADDDSVHITFPDADFSSEKVRQALKDEVTAEVAQILSETDWMVLESLEIGTPVPPEVVAERQRVRDKGQALKETIDTLEVSELLEFSWTLQEEATPL